MGDLSGLILLLLPMAAATGWFVARQSRPREEEEGKLLNPDYVRGISHLVNNDTDQAIEVFIGLMDADEATIDLHLALGSLFRRRGEVDRALRIHQNLVKRPQLKPVHRNQARYELAKDYLAAGVLDRAEEIFLELAHQGMFLVDCLNRLMRIYESEREWDRAIDVAAWLGSAQGRDLGAVIAQYYCEKAEAAARRDDPKAEQGCLKKALAADRHCVRAQMIKARIAEQGDQHAEALKRYRDIVDHHAEFIPEIIESWKRCVVRLRGADAWMEEVHKCYRSHPDPQLQLALIQASTPLAALDPAAREELLADLRLHPSWVGLHALLNQSWPQLDASMSAVMRGLADSLAVPLEQSPRYRCSQCGYSARMLNWQCPSCQEWNSTQPLADMSYAALDSVAHSASAVG